MKLIILLVALACERFLYFGRYIYRFNWFGPYLNLMRSWVSGSGLWRDYAGVIIALLPPLIIFIIVYWILVQIFGLILAFVIEFIIVFYCFGPEDIYYYYQLFFNASEQGNVALGYKQIEDLMKETPADATNPHRAITKSIFLNFNESIFAIVFWFSILGYLGIFIVLFYRLVALIQRESAKPYNNHTSLFPAAKNIKDILDWIPIRLLGIGYALAGNFVHGFQYWLKNVLSGPNQNEKFATESGFLALNIENTDPATATVSENKAALDLTDRVLIIYLVIVALLTLGMLL